METVGTDCGYCGSAIDLEEDETPRCTDCGVFLCSSCLQECSDCREQYCPDHVWPCPADKSELLCGSCIDYHDCCPIGEHDTVYKVETPGEFLIGLEIEVAGKHDQSYLKSSPLIAGWGHDDSLCLPGAGEYQTQPLGYSPGTIAALVDLVRHVKPVIGDQHEAGGHMHIERSLTGHQSCRGWEIALSGLTGDQARALNMRHATPGRNYYCKLYEGDHRGKHCAVNGEHERTIELRTFGAWDCSTACKLAPAIKWVHGMWEWFESWPPAGVPDDWLAIDEKVIKNTSSRVADSVLRGEHADKTTNVHVDYTV